MKCGPHPGVAGCFVAPLSEGGSDRFFWGLHLILEAGRIISFYAIGVSPSGKAAVFGIAIRRFESFHPNMCL